MLITTAVKEAMSNDASLCLLQDSAPCVLFFDEIDSITPKRENAQREMERRIVAQLLACLDGN